MNFHFPVDIYLLKTWRFYLLQRNILPMLYNCSFLCLAAACLIFPAQEFPISHFQVLAAKSRQKATADFHSKTIYRARGLEVRTKIYNIKQQQIPIYRAHWLANISASKSRQKYIGVKVCHNRFPTETIYRAHRLVNILGSFECRGGWGGMTVMFAHHQPTSYGALYVASPLYVYGWPLGLWVKVIQFTRENKHGCQNKTLGTAYFLLKTSLFKDSEDEEREFQSVMLQWRKGWI